MRPAQSSSSPSLSLKSSMSSLASSHLSSRPLTNIAHVSVEACRATLAPSWSHCMGLLAALTSGGNCVSSSPLSLPIPAHGDVRRVVVVVPSVILQMSSPTKISRDVGGVNEKTWSLKTRFELLPFPLPFCEIMGRSARTVHLSCSFKN